MPCVGVIAIGMLMAKRLHEMGHKLAVWNRNAERKDIAIAIAVARSNGTPIPILHQVETFGRMIHQRPEFGQATA